MTEAEERIRIKAERSVTGKNKLTPGDREWLFHCLLPSGYYPDRPTGTELFAQTFLRASFGDAMIPQRRDYFRHLDDDTIPQLATIAARTFMKTTGLWAFLCRCACFKLQPFILYVGETNDFATTQTENIKSELLSNPAIRKFWGKMKPESYEGDSPAFSKSAYFLAQGNEPFMFVSPRGAEQQVNGSLVRLLGKMTRPSIIASDDGEDRKTIGNEEQRRKHRNWFNEALLPCVDTTKRPVARTRRWNLKGDPVNNRPPYRIIVGDTLKHEDANMAHLRDDPSWVVNIYPRAERVWDEKTETARYISLWPELVSDTQIEREVEQARNQGGLDGYAREYMCKPYADEASCWTRSMFKYYRDAEQSRFWRKREDTVSFLVVDPAKTAKQTSAYTSILAVTGDPRTNRIHYRRNIVERLSAQDIYSKTLDLAVELQIPNIAVEATGLEDIIKYGFETAVAQRRLESNISFMWLKAGALPKGDYGTGREAIKRARGSLSLGLYQMGLIYHDESFKDEMLERSQLSFPNCKFWDALDCSGYVPQILKKLGFYLLPEISTDAKSEFPDSTDDYKYAGALFSRRENWCVAL